MKTLLKLSAGCFALGALPTLVFADPAKPAPEWWKAIDFLTTAFDPARVFAPIAPLLDKFQLVFTGIAVAAVLISAVLKVARARNGEESMGWVASTVAIAALMAIAPSLGTRVFAAADSVGKWSGYDKFSAITTCWSTVLLCTPPDSAAKESMDDAVRAAAPEPTDLSWYNRAWDWTTSVLTGIKNSATAFYASVKNGLTRILLTIMLIIPTVAMVIAVLLTLLGEFLRQLLFYGMGIFLPFFIGMLSFGPMSGAARSFLLKYVSVAFWPVAWALGNALSLSLLSVIAQWIVESSMAVIAAASGSAAVGPVPSLGPATSGLLAIASAHMAWGLLLIALIAIVFCALLLIVSAVVAPMLLSSTLVKGSCFVGGLLGAGVSAAGPTVGGLATAGAGLVASGAAMRGAASVGRVSAGLGGRAAGALNGAAGALSKVAEGGGMMGRLAGFGAAALNRAAGAAHAGGNFGRSAALTMADAVRPAGGGRQVASMMNTLGDTVSAASSIDFGSPDKAGRSMGAFMAGPGKKHAAAAGGEIANSSAVRAIRSAAARSYRWAERGRY